MIRWRKIGVGLSVWDRRKKSQKKPRVSQEVRGNTRRTLSSFTYKIMKTSLSSRAGLAGLLIALIAAGTPAFAHEGHNKDKDMNKAPAADHAGMNMPADSAAAVAAFPLSTCVVSGDKLEDGDMGPPINYVYKQEGKPDRLVRLCCKSCVKDFNKNPEEFLKMIDDAAAAKAKGEKPATPAPSGHGNH